MTGTSKLVWGAFLMIGAMIVAMLGLALCCTFIGALLGIPMILAAMPFGIWGLVWIIKGRIQSAREVLAAGIARGIARGIRDSR